MSTIEELERDHPVYDRKVPVKVRQTGRDERVADLTIRVVMGVRASHGQRDRLMHIELTDDSDLNFLFALDVTEDEFHELKQDQSLLVEFTSFAPKFCELLESCRASVGWFSERVVVKVEVFGVRTSRRRRVCSLALLN